MKPSTMFIACSLAAAMTCSVWSQAQPERRPTERPAERQAERQDRPTQLRLGEREAVLHHVADIHNLRVTNMDRENLGTIQTLVADAQNGKIVYGVVSVGGFLGIADTLVAVPWEAFQQRPMYEGLVLNVTRSQLEAAPQFDRRQWPNFGDDRWGQEVHRYYGTTPRTPGAQPHGEPLRTPRDNPEHQQPQQQQPRQPGAERLFVRTNELIGTTIENRQGESLGNFDNIAMNVETGEIEFAVVGIGGFLGFWQSHVTVPWESLQITARDGQYRVVLDVTQERLERAPEYDMNKWPEKRDGEWARDQFPADRRPADRPGQPRDR